LRSGARPREELFKVNDSEKKKKFVYGEITGIPVTEEQMKSYEEAQKNRVKSSAEQELDDMADEFKSRMVKKSFKPMKAGGKISSASKRADGIAQRGKTRGKMV